jgi:uncharacterized membrane protein
MLKKGKSCYNLTMFIKVVGSFFIGILAGFILEFSFRSIEARKFFAPKLVDLQMYGLIGSFLVFIYYLNIGLIYKLILMFVVPTLIEFLTGYLYLKIKKVYLWTYFHQKFNFMGLVCPLFSLFWFLISLAYYFFVLPYVLNI